MATKSRLNDKRKLAKKSAETELKLMDTNPGHDKHLCHIVAIRNMKTLAKLSKNAQYICLVCGRAAKNKTNLCLPNAIE